MYRLRGRSMHPATLVINIVLDEVISSSYLASIHYAYTDSVSDWTTRLNSGGPSCDRGLKLYQPQKGLNIKQKGHTNHIHQTVKALNDIPYIVVAQAAIED